MIPFFFVDAIKLRNKSSVCGYVGRKANKRKNRNPERGKPRQQMA